MAMSRSKSRSNHYFPEEIIFKILSWTKASSLLRFKSVCKLWCSIISDKNFIELHHTNSLRSTPSILMINVDVGKNNRYEGVAASILYSDSPKNSVNLPLQPSFDFDCMEFISSCNGIVCVRDFKNGGTYLFNPLTRMSKRVLPLFVLPLQPPEVDIQLRKADLAFGFDCLSHDFKVLRFTYAKEVISNDTNLLYEQEGFLNDMNLIAVHSYSSNADSWRKIEINLTLPTFKGFITRPILLHGPVLDGVLYLNGEKEIVWFDLHNEIFGLIPFGPDRHKSHVLDFEGRVAMIFESGGERSVEKDISLWTVEVVSGEVLWNKVLTFETSLKIDWVFFYLGAKQFVGQTSDEEIFLYDYSKKKTNYTGVSSESLVTVFGHTESFLSIKGFE